MKTVTLAITFQVDDDVDPDDLEAVIAGAFCQVEDPEDIVTYEPTIEFKID